VSVPAFAKNPKVIGGVIVVLWLAYLIYWNYQLDPIRIQLVPFVRPAQLSVSSVIIGAAVFGCIATLVIQFLWRRRSKNGSVASTEPIANNKTVA
jgi:hypothetical protein